MADLGALTGEERHELAIHFAGIAKHTAALAKAFDPTVKGAVGAAKEKSDVPKIKRAPTAYNIFMQQHLKPFKAEVRSRRVCAVASGLNIGGGLRGPAGADAGPFARSVTF